MAGKAFKCNIQKSKTKFFRAANGVFGKIATFASPSVVLSLIAASCIPVLTYGLNAVNLNTSACQSLDGAYGSIYANTFKVQDKRNIAQCQYYSGYLPVSCQVHLQTLNFLENIMKLSIAIQYTLFNWYDRQKYQEILNRYNIKSISDHWTRKRAVECWFEENVFA